MLWGSRAQQAAAAAAGGVALPEGCCFQPLLPEGCTDTRLHLMGVLQAMRERLGGERFADRLALLDPRLVRALSS